jgi:hypothetical protein
MYILLNKNKTVENYSWLSFSDIFDFYGYKKTGNKPKAYFEILDVLEYLKYKEYIKVINDVELNNQPSYKTALKFSINKNKFNPKKHFVNLSIDEMYAVLEVAKENNIPVDSALLSFVLIKNKKRNYKIMCTNKELNKLPFNLFTKDSENYNSLMLIKEENGYFEYELNQNFHKKNRE